MDNQSQPAASTSFVQIPVSIHHPHIYDYKQLPTTQSLSVANNGPSYPHSSPLRKHGVEIEEVQDEDKVRPQPFSADSAELDIRTDFEPESTGGLYTVVELMSIQMKMQMGD